MFFHLAALPMSLITGNREPFNISKIEGKSNQEFIFLCISEDPEERPTFSEICQFIVKKSFMDLFGHVIIERVDDFFDLFDNEQDPFKNDKELKLKQIKIRQKIITKQQQIKTISNLECSITAISSRLN